MEAQFQDAAKLLIQKMAPIDYFDVVVITPENANKLIREYETRYLFTGRRWFLLFIEEYKDYKNLHDFNENVDESGCVCFGDLNMLVEFLYDEIQEYEKDKDEFMNWRLVDSPPIQIPPEYESSVSHPC